MSDRVPNYSRQELCNEVFAAVSRSTKQMSRRDIAAAIGRKKSPHVIAMIEHLVKSGYFVKEVGEDKSGRLTLFYSAQPVSAEVACQ